MPENPFDLAARFEGLDIPSLTVLNLGSGKFDSLISQQLLNMPFAELWNVDAFGPYIEQARTLIYQARFVHFAQGKIEAFVQTHGVAKVPPKRDVVLLLDVLEHFEKEDALWVWERAKELTRSRLLLWIPVGLCEQEEYDRNPYQKHLSTWSLEDLQVLGGTIQHYPAVHKHFNPPVDGAWVIWEPKV